MALLLLRRTRWVATVLTLIVTISPMTRCRVILWVMALRSLLRSAFVILSPISFRVIVLTSLTFMILSVNVLGGQTRV